MKILDVVLPMGWVGSLVLAPFLFAYGDMDLIVMGGAFFVMLTWALVERAAFVWHRSERRMQQRIEDNLREEHR